MKYLSLFFVVFFVRFSGFSQSNRNTIKLNELVWKSSCSCDDSNVESKFSNSKVVDFSSATNFDTSTVFIAELEADNLLPNMLTFSCYGPDPINKVIFNSTLVKNTISDGNFYADITPLLKEGKNFVELSFLEPISGIKLKSILKNGQLSFFNGLGFTKIEMKEDDFLGGKLILANIMNFNSSDADGKIYVKLLNEENFEQLSESNNCAFVRSGKEISVEISFPGYTEQIKGKRALAELSIVDKENDEELIDSITISLGF